jgi:DNA invertase Pin-like site-specific DNA recombinase
VAVDWQAERVRSLPPPNRMTTFAYTRLSPHNPVASDHQALAAMVDRLYVDHCEVQDPRPELQRFLHDCRQELPEQVLIPQVGDLGSSPAAVFAVLQALEDQGILVTTADGSYRTVSATSSERPPELLFQLAATVAEQHRHQQLEAGHARNRINLLPPPGRAPYGYRRGRYRYALDKAAAPAVKAFFEQFILYGSIRGAARFLDKKYGKKIAPSTAQRWLQHPIYRGDSEYKDGQVIRDTHTPIISRDEAAQVDRLLRRNRQLPPKTVSAERSLAGTGALCRVPEQTTGLASHPPATKARLPIPPPHTVWPRKTLSSDRLRHGSSADDCRHRSGVSPSCRELSGPTRGSH